MTNIEKYNSVFKINLGVKDEALPELRYRKTAKWDSMAHMDIISDLEEKFRIRFTTVDMLAFVSYEKGKEIMAGYGIVFDE